MTFIRREVRFEAVLAIHSVYVHYFCKLFMFFSVFVPFRNGVNVEGATHKQVVDLIKTGGDSLTISGNASIFTL